MGIIFRDESNKPSFTMIGYSDATVTAPNNPLLVRPKASFATVMLQCHIFRGDSVISLYLVPLINDQSCEKVFINFFSPPNQTWPNSSAAKGALI